MEGDSSLFPFPSLQQPHPLQPLEPFPFFPDLEVPRFFLQPGLCFPGAGGWSRRRISFCTQPSAGFAQSSGRECFRGENLRVGGQQAFLVWPITPPQPNHQSVPTRSGTLTGLPGWDSLSLVLASCSFGQYCRGSSSGCT